MEGPSLLKRVREDLRKKLDLPELLLVFRQTKGVSRRQVCEETGLTENRLRSLEIGEWQTMKIHEREVLSRYYGIPLKKFSALVCKFVRGEKLSRRKKQALKI